MSKKELFRRYLLFIFGLFVNAIGICLIIKSDLGSSPISSLPYTLSLKYPMTLGTLTFILNLFLIAGQMYVLKKNFQKKQWLQLPISFLFALFVDTSMFLLAWVSPELYLWKLVSLTVGCIILGFGVSLEVVANVVMLSGEAFVHAISITYKKEFGVIKIFFDTSLMLLAIIASLFIFNSIVGVREGTIVAALFVGVVARFFNSRLGFLNKILTDEKLEVAPVISQKSPEGKQLIITIAREFGSGGHEIGQKVAEALDIAFYDKELIDIVVSENKNLTRNFVEKHEQNIPNSLLYELLMQDFTSPIEQSLSLDDTLFVAQSKVIRQLASQQSLVVVGRCADYVLQDYENSFNIFVHADSESKLKRVVEEYGELATEAEYKLKKTDKARANHYKAYTGRSWNDAKNYDLCIDTSAGIAQAVDIIVFAVKKCLR